MKTFGSVIKFLPGTSALRESWASTMNSRMAEAQASIFSEGVECESWFNFNIGTDTYAFVVMCKSERDQVIDAELALPIDQVHREFKKTWNSAERFSCKTIQEFSPGELLPFASLQIVLASEIDTADKSDQAKFEFEVDGTAFVAFYDRGASEVDISCEAIECQCVLNVFVEDCYSSLKPSDLRPCAEQSRQV